MTSGAGRRPLSALFVKIVTAAQILALLGAAPLALVYRARALHTGDGLTPSEDRQFTAVGYDFVFGLAVVSAVLLAIGWYRLGAGSGRGRVAMLVAEIVIIFGGAAAADSLDGPHNRSNIYTDAAVMLTLSAVAVIVAMYLPRVRAWSRHTVSEC